MRISGSLLSVLLLGLTACADSPTAPVTSDFDAAHSVMPASTSQTVDILVDASKGGGLWWYPQGGPFDPALPHQGKALADYLRGRGLVVTELPRPTTVQCEELSRFSLVMAAPFFHFTYTQDELTAYRNFVRRGGRLILITGGHNSPDLGEQFGLSFAGGYSGVVTSFVAHPITAGVTSLSPYYGSALATTPATATPLGYLYGLPIMGLLSYGRGQVFFMGGGIALLYVPQPFTGNLFDFMLADAHPVFSCPVTSPSDIAQQVAAMNLDPGEQSSLVAKLNAAEKSIAKDNFGAAANQIRAFINEVEAMNRSGRLSSSGAELLMTLAEELIDYID